MPTLLYHGESSFDMMRMHLLTEHLMLWWAYAVTTP